MATSAPKPAPKLVPKATGTSNAPSKQKPEGDEGAPVIKKKSKKKTILIAGIVAILLGAAGGAAFVFTGASDTAPADPNAPAEEVKAKTGPEQPPLFAVVEPFTVNLQHEGPSDQFLQISFSLQLGDRKQEELFKLYQPQARSRMLLLLSGKKASEISTVEGKKKLAEEIAATLRTPFSEQSPPLDVKDVFFTSFVIQ